MRGAMMLSFVMSFEKKNRANLGQCEGHNNRGHPTKSQLPKEAWFDEESDYTVTPWDSKKIDLAKSLSKRKDAVLAIEFVIAVGNQSDWRDAPTEDHPHGKPKEGMRGIIKALAAGAKEAAENEFGAENVVGINLHLDESTPHIHVVVTPIKEGKLQAKHWTGGVKACEELRERMWFSVNKTTPCSYVRGNGGGGEPHDAAKAAGAQDGPQLAAKRGLLASGAAMLDFKQQLQDLKSVVAGLRKQVAGLFSNLKKSQLAKAKALKERDSAVTQSKIDLSEKDEQSKLAIEKLSSKYEEKLARSRSALDEQREMNDQLAKRNNALLQAAARDKFAT